MDRIKAFIRTGYAKAFAIALIVAFCVYLPYVILDNGILLLTNDFQTQQIPFYMLTNDAVKDGATISWTTGLGTSVLGSYSFYTLGSVFYWLVFWLPSAALPYVMFPLLCLKFGVGALTSYAWLKRYIKNDTVRIFSALLYAFSGFMIFNVFYNHFLDVAALFPLMLIALDELCENGRKGVFALTVTLLLMTNYVFFVGEVVFVVAYYFIKCAVGAYKLSLKQLFHIAAEAVLGVLGGAVMFTAVLFIMGNPRNGDKIDLAQMFLYNWEQYINILSGFFFPADAPQISPYYVKNGETRWQSAYAFLPLVSLCGVIAFIKRNKKHFVSVALIFSGICALLPVLNSAFSAFTSVYYARWFFMPLLLAALATGLAFDDIEKYRTDILFGKRVVIIITTVIAAASLIMRFVVSGASLDFYEGLALTVGFVALTLCGLFVLSLILQKDNVDIPRALVKITAFASAALMTIPAMTYFGANCNGNEEYKENLVYSRDLFDDLKDDRFFRVDTTNIFHNSNMWWGLSSVELFNSNISAGEFAFYQALGYNRTVYTAPPDSLYALRSFLSVKYLINYTDKEDFLTGKMNKVPFGYSYLNSRADYSVYQNSFYIPMGFTFDYYISEEDFLNIDSSSKRAQALLKAIVLTDEQIEKYDYLKPSESSVSFKSFSTVQYEEDCKTLDENGCTTFETNNSGFTASITLDKKNLVFFTVPYEKGYTATVNGNPVEIEQTDFGFMAVECPEGLCKIRFTYQPYGYSFTAWISVIAIIIELILIAASRKNKNI